MRIFAIHNGRFFFRWKFWIKILGIFKIIISVAGNIVKVVIDNAYSIIIKEFAEEKNK